MLYNPLFRWFFRTLSSEMGAVRKDGPYWLMDWGQCLAWRRLLSDSTQLLYLCVPTAVRAQIKTDGKQSEKCIISNSFRIPAFIFQHEAPRAWPQGGARASGPAEGIPRAAITRRLPQAALRPPSYLAAWGRFVGTAEVGYEVGLYIKSSLCMYTPVNTYNTCYSSM